MREKKWTHVTITKYYYIIRIFLDVPNIIPFCAFPRNGAFNCWNRVSSLFDNIHRMDCSQAYVRQRTFIF